MAKLFDKNLQVEEKRSVNDEMQTHNANVKVIHDFDLNKIPPEEEELHLNKEITDVKPVRSFDLNKRRNEGDIHPDKEIEDMILMYLPEWF